LLRAPNPIWTLHRLQVTDTHKHDPEHMYIISLRLHHLRGFDFTLH
jgi:hypothetical protein